MTGCAAHRQVATRSLHQTQGEEQTQTGAARLVTGVVEDVALARIPAESALVLDGRFPACAALEAAAQAAMVLHLPGEPNPLVPGLLVRVAEAAFPAALLPAGLSFEVRVAGDGQAPPLRRFRAHALLGPGLRADVAFAVLLP